MSQQYFVRYERWGSRILYFLAICGALIFVETAEIGDRDRFSVLWLSDIHFDPAFTVTAPNKLKCRDFFSYFGVKKKEFKKVHGTESSTSRIHKNGPLSVHKNISPIVPTNPLKQIYRFNCDVSNNLYTIALEFMRERIANMGYKKNSDSELESVASIDETFPKIECVIITGDIAAHYPLQESRNRKLALAQATELLGEYLAPQVIISFGNSDIPFTYMFPWKRLESSIALFEIFERYIPADEESKTGFLNGLYYSTILHSRPDILMISFNSYLYSSKYRTKAVEQLKEFNKALSTVLKSIDASNTDIEAALDAAKHLRESASEKAMKILYSQVEDYLKDSVDPAGQFEWLRSELRRAKQNNQQVIFVGHIPPLRHMVVDKGNLLYTYGWVQYYLDEFRSIVAEHSDIIIGQFYGHHHMNYMKLMKPDESSAKPVLKSCAPSQVQDSVPVFVGSSLSADSGSNPAFKVLQFMRGLKPLSSGEPGFVLHDEVQYHLNLSGFIPSMEEKQFRVEYSFQNRYSSLLNSTAGSTTDPQSSFNTSCIDGNMLEHFSQKLLLSKALYNEYSSHFYAGGGGLPNVTLYCLFSCNSFAECNECISNY